MINGTVEQSDSIAKLVKSLVTAQKDFKPLVKDKKNPFFSSMYAALPDVINAVLPSLNKNGLTVLQMQVPADPGHVALVTMLAHESGEFVRSTGVAKLDKDTAQGIVAGTTYLRRNGLSSITGICADDDDDGNSASGNTTTAKSELVKSTVATKSTTAKKTLTTTEPTSSPQDEVTAVQPETSLTEARQAFRSALEQADYSGDDLNSIPLAKKIIATLDVAFGENGKLKDLTAENWLEYSKSEIPKGVTV